MIIGHVRGQELKLDRTTIAADSIKYLEAEFHFAGRGWDGYVKTAYFINGTSKFALVLADDRITADMGLNLTAGEWEVKLSGVKGGSRITTTTEHIYVREFGSTDGALPDVTATQAEQILAKIGDLSALTTEDKTNLVAAINEAAKSGGGGSGGGKDGTGIASITYKGEDEDGGNVYTVLLTDGTSYEITAPKGAKGDKGDTGATGPQGPAGAPGKDGASMGITGATVGQIAKITAVDTDGKPTAWEPVDMPSSEGGGTVVNYNTINQHFYNSGVIGKYDLKDGHSITPDIYIATDGAETANAGLNFAVTDYIPVEQNVPYTTFGQGYALYAADKTFVSAVINNANFGELREFTPTQSGFVRITFRKGSITDFARFCKSEDKTKPFTAYMPKLSPFFDPAIPCEVDLYGDSNSCGYGLSDAANSWANRLGSLIINLPSTILNKATAMSVFASEYSGDPKLRTNGVLYFSAYTDSFIVYASFVGAINVKIDGVEQTQITASPATYTVGWGYHTIELSGASGPNNVINSIKTNKKRSFTNNAVSGTSSSNLVNAAPSGNVAMVMYGTNDRATEYGAAAECFAEFLRKCNASGIEVYLFSPIPTKSTGETNTAYKQTIGAVISQIPNVNYIDVYKDMQLFTLLSTENLYNDSLHLNDFGHKVLFAIAASSLHLAALNSIFD